jgi:putative transposase
MNRPKADELDYIHFLIAAQKVFTCTEAARSQPESPDPPAHDAFTRLLSREPPDTEALWEEARTLVEPERGLLVVDGVGPPALVRQASPSGQWDQPRHPAME